MILKKKNRYKNISFQKHVLCYILSVSFFFYNKTVVLKNIKVKDKF